MIASTRRPKRAKWITWALAIAASCGLFAAVANATQTPYGPNNNPAPAGHVYGTTGLAPRIDNAVAANFSGAAPYVEVWYRLQSGSNYPVPAMGGPGHASFGTSNGKYAYAHCETTTGSPLGMACATDW